MQSRAVLAIGMQSPFAVRVIFSSVYKSSKSTTATEPYVELLEQSHNYLCIRLCKYISMGLI